MPNNYAHKMFKYIYVNNAVVRLPHPLQAGIGRVNWQLNHQTSFEVSSCQLHTVALYAAFGGFFTLFAASICSQIDLDIY